MPKDFERCVKGGGRVRTISLPHDKYVHVCYLKGKSYRGEVKTKHLAKALSKGPARKSKAAKRSKG